MELRPLVLALLDDGPLYGYQIVVEAKRRGKLQWEEGTLYPLLHKMEREGLLASKWRRAPNGKDRKYYSLSRKGRGALARARSEWKDAVQVISGILMGGRHGVARGIPS